ncbi:MAG: nuclear transport factor 2 family protein [Acidobacteria bacterium]|nr:nuclear transport factor 2 family protein [Acidobacteriota bacterium]
MNRVSKSILAIVFLMGAPAVAQSDGAAKSSQKPYVVGMSLDTLVSRIDGYWNALLQNKKAQAAKYIAAEDRDKFYDSKTPSFSNPHLKSLEFSADGREAKVTVAVTRSMPPSGTKIDWPVTERWRFENGNWYRTIPDRSPFLLFETQSKEKSDSEDTETLKSEIQKLMMIEDTVLDFGTVRENTTVRLSVKYTLGGEERLGMTISTPAGFGIQGGNEQILNPGNHELQIIVPTWRMDGAVNERIIMTARRGGATVPFEIEVKGNVYVPVSIAPKTLKFKREESEKEVRIRNNTKSDLELLSVYSETSQVAVQPIPVAVPPSQEIVLKVKLGEKSATLRANQSDNLAISLARPVDGVNSLSLHVIINAEDTVKDGLKTNAKEEVDPSKQCKNCQVPAVLK